MAEPPLDPPRPDPDPLFDAIGRVAFAWSDLEQELRHLLVAITHTPIAGILTAGLSYDTLRRHLDGIVNLPPALEQYDSPRQRMAPDVRPRIKQEFQELKRLQEMRNRIVHGLWARDPGPYEWVNLKPARDKMLVPPYRFTTDEMHQVARDIEAVSARLEVLGIEIDPRLYGRPEPAGG